MAKKSEELIEKPVASRGRPRKDASTSTTKKASKSKTKKKTTKKASSSKKSVSKKTKNSTTSKKLETVELIQDVQLETTIENTITSEPDLEETVIKIENAEPEIIVQTQENIEPSEVEINTDAKDEEKNEEILEQQEQVPEEIVPVISDEQNSDVQKKSNKRTIRNISIKRPSITEVEKNIEIEKESDVQETLLEEVPKKTEAIEENVPSENNKLENNEFVQEEKVIELPKREKRTLRLNLGSHKKQETISESTHKKDESINQNSSFFNEPSIFAKFNIDITSTENEESSQSVEETSTSEEVNFNQADIESNNESQEILSINEITEEKLSEELLDVQIEELIEDVLNNELQPIEEPNNELVEKVSATSLSDEDIEKAILEEISETISEEIIENEIENSDILNSVRSILEEKLDSLEDLSSTTSENNTSTENEIITENNISFKTDIENEEQQNEFWEISQQESVELKEVAETIVPAEPTIEKTSDNSPIGKFFDSSIPSMTSTVNNTFSKIKKSIFSNISPIFKKFTFEEATLRTHADELENNYIEPENNLSDIQKALKNFTPNIQATSNITEMNIQAEPVVSIPVIETDTLLSTEMSNNTYDISNLNIITPESESSYDNTDNLEEITSEIENKENIVSEDINNKVESKNNSLELIEEEYNDNEFSIESYFGLDNVALDENNSISSEEIEIPEEPETIDSIPENFADKFLEAYNKETLIDTEELLEENEDNEEIKESSTSETNELEKTLKEKELEISNLSKLLESFTQTISTLTNRITDLENKQLAEKEFSQKITETDNDDNNEILETSEIIVEETKDIVSELIETDSKESVENLEQDDINLDDIDIGDLDLKDFDLNDFDITENIDSEIEEPSLLSQEENSEEESKSVESILSEVFLSKELDSNLKDELLSEVLSYEETLSEDETNLDDVLLQEALLDELSDEDLTNLEPTDEDQEPLSDFSKIIDSLTKAITELEQAPDIKQEVEKKNVVTPLAPLPAELTNYTASEEKAINILINKDDIFSISILNETYEIVADFDGISVLSENLHISTPKNNFFVRVGNKYIEIHNKKDNFVLNTNFEDIEFANAINNIAFAKKNNKIELNIKEAFKLSSVNNKIELSMLNKAIADLSTTSQTTEQKDESSICDNKTLLISEETQKVYLPYTIEDVMKKLKSSEEYQTVQEIVDNEYTLPLSTFKMPIISRFKEAYRFMRTKENSSVYAAVDLALELMFNSNLNPAVIRAAKDLKELNIYLDCLYENEVEKFDCFKIVYKVLPKIK